MTPGEIIKAGALELEAGIYELCADVQDPIDSTSKERICVFADRWAMYHVALQHRFCLQKDRRLEAELNYNLKYIGLPDARMEVTAFITPNLPAYAIQLPQLSAGVELWVLAPGRMTVSWVQKPYGQNVIVYHYGVPVEAKLANLTTPAPLITPSGYDPELKFEVVFTGIL